MNYIVTNKDGLLVRAQMDTRNPHNIKRKMSNGEGFIVYQTYVKNANQVWGRVSDNPGDVQQEYTCLSIANRTFAKIEISDEELKSYKVNPRWIIAIDLWARSKGYTDVLPFE